MGRRPLADQGDGVIESAHDLPPRWAEYVLRLLLNPRDCDPITGDLLEEYREVALPAMGPGRASLWYLRQAGSIMANNSQTSMLAALFVGAGALLLGALSFVMVRSNFGPPSHEIIPFGGVAALAIVLAVSGASVVRSAGDLEPAWRVARVWGAALALCFVGAAALRLAAPSLLMEDGPLPHPGHLPEIAPIVSRLFVIAIAAIFIIAGFRGAWRTRQVRQGIVAAIATAVIAAAIAFVAGTAVNIAFAPAGSGFTLEGGPIPYGALIVAPMLSTFPGVVGAMFGRGFGGLSESHRDTAAGSTDI